MVKFILGAWLLLFGLVASTQIFDFWRLDSKGGVELASFCEGSSCRNERYSARVFYLYGDVDRVLIRDSAEIEVGCGVEKATHLKAQPLWRGDSVEGVRGKDHFDRASKRSQVVTELGVFLPCDAPEDASAYGFAVAMPVWVKQGIANFRSSVDVTH